MLYLWHVISFLFVERSWEESISKTGRIQTGKIKIKIPYRYRKTPNGLTLKTYLYPVYGTLRINLPSPGFFYSQLPLESFSCIVTRCRFVHVKADNGNKFILSPFLMYDLHKCRQNTRKVESFRISPDAQFINHQFQVLLWMWLEINVGFVSLVTDKFSIF